MEKKKNFIIWLLVIVIIVLLALVFVLYKDKNKVSDNTVNEEDNIENQIEEVTTLDINSSEVQELEKIYDLIFTSTCGYIPSKKLFNDGNYFFKDIPNYAAIKIILKYEGKNDSPFEKEFTNEELSLIKNDYKALFGEQNELIIEEEFGVCPRYFYKNGTLSTSDGNCGCGSGYSYPEAFDSSIKAIVNNDEIKVYKKIGFLVDTEVKVENELIEKYIVSKDVNENESLIDIDFMNKEFDDIKEEANNYFENNQDKFNTYIVSYKKNSDGSYYIYSIEKEK